jgi:hypothetical protein
MADVPAVFGEAIRWAWKHDTDVWTGNPFNDDHREIRMISTHGTVTLVWKSKVPHAVNAVWFRPFGTSVQRRVATVNDALRSLAGTNDN